jgi:signal transduction histidine kinase
MGEIDNRAEHLTRLVEDLLLVAQLAPSSQARPRITTSKADYVDVLRGVVAELAETHPDHSIELHAPDTLPGATDPLRLRQILSNLIDNACKYSAPASIVAVTLASDDQHVTIDVTDRGRGIPPEDVQRVFERFERVEDPLHMTTSGAGLGLYIARSLAKALGGEITLHSMPGVGTTVTVSLPRATSDRRAAPKRDSVKSH